MKLRINEKDTSMKYKTYGNIEKCFNILIHEKGYSKKEAQDIIDNMLADYKYNPNSADSLLRRINLVLPKDEYEKEYGIAESIRINERDTNDTISLKDVIKNAKIAAKRDGYFQDIFIDKNGEYGFMRHYSGNLSDWNGEQLIGQVQTSWNNGIFSVSYVDDESLFRESKETPNIEVKNKGILEVPEGKNVDNLPLSHFVNLANKKGLSKITKALNNLQVWNKNDDPKLSKWAGDMIDKLNKKLKKDESLNKSLVKEDAIDDLVPDKVYTLSVLNDWWYDVIEQAKKFGIKDSEIDSKDENTLLFTFPAWDGLGYDRYERLYNWCVTHIYNSPEYIEAYKELHESLTKENSKKSYWKYYQNDKAIERMENSDRYFDEHSIRQVKLYPCETEDDCYAEEYSWL